MTDSTKSKRVLDLCDNAVLLLGDERERFLSEACAGDSRLRASVDSVLQAIEDSGNFLKISTPLADEDEDLVGKKIGSYEILERLGEGGMGAVYLAERQEDDFSQRVAIKFVRGHLLGRELIERFNSERKILAALNHPYIAALIDGGTTPDGVPYLVMEYVEGVPIDQYCDAHRLGIRERILLIRKVAMAVQAAHQNLIVHRDLKPSNVLITADGIPKLLDFGIAKLIQPEDATPSGNTTVFGRQAMTPDYASPEQILENRVTTASDVYTLGVLTYQLLVGERPYHIQTTSHREMMRSLEALSVPRPSTRLDTIPSADLRQEIANHRATTLPKLHRTLKGDLDNVLLMALRQEQERRYGSVAQFSDDLGRYLDGLPVFAREDSVTYRTRKFLQRNWLATGAAGLIALSLAAGMLGYAVQAREAQHQRDIAREQVLQTRHTLDFLKDVLFAGDPFSSRENEETIADVLQYAEKHVGDEYANDPASRATILAALADIYAARGEYIRSEKLASDAVQIYETELGTDNNAAANAYRVYALALYYRDDYQQAAGIFDTAISLYRQQSEPDWTGLVRAYDQMAMVHDNLTDEETALDFYNLALATYNEQQLNDSALLISVLGNIGTAHLQKGDYARADSALVQGIKVARENNAGDGQTAILVTNYAGVLKNLGKFDEAVLNYNDAVRLMSNSIGPEHPETIATLTSLANLHQQMDNLEQAEAVIRQAISAADNALPPDHFIASYVQNVGGSILCRRGKAVEGTRHAEASLQTRRKLLPPGHWAISSGEGILGTCLAVSGQFAAAEAALLQAYGALRESRGDDHEVTLGMKERLLELYTEWGKPEEARKFEAGSE